MVHRQILILLQIILSTAFAYHIPPYVHLCKRHDPNIEKCVANTINEMLPYLRRGIREMNIPPLDPLQVHSFSVDTGSGTPVKFKAELFDVVMKGVSNFELKNLTYDLDHGRLSMTMYFPYLNIKSRYKIRGSVLLFQLDGSGPNEFNATGVLCSLDSFGKYTTKENKTYLIFDRIDVTIVPDTMAFRFENMFPGNQALNDALNNAVNANVKSLSQDLSPLIKSTLTQITLEYFNRVFGIFPMDVLYPLK